MITLIFLAFKCNRRLAQPSVDSPLTGNAAIDKPVRNADIIIRPCVGLGSIETRPHEISLNSDTYHRPRSCATARGYDQGSQVCSQVYSGSRAGDWISRNEAHELI